STSDPSSIAEELPRPTHHPCVETVRLQAAPLKQMFVNDCWGSGLDAPGERSIRAQDRRVTLDGWTLHVARVRDSGPESRIRRVPARTLAIQESPERCGR